MSYTDEELYGEDLVRDARRWARQELGGELNQLKAQMAQNTTETNHQRCQNALDNDPELGGKWRALNNDPKFVAWLNVNDELFGANRLAGLRQAFDIGAWDRVKAIFKAFIASQIPARERTNQRLPFENSAKQPAVRPSADGYAVKRRVFKPGEIAKFYDDCRRGRYDGREVERNQIEAEILAAANQGRVAAAAQQPRMPGRRPWE